MTSLIKVDEMESHVAPLMKFNTGAYNLAQTLTVTGGSAPASERTQWDAEAIPVVRLPVPTGAVLNVMPNVPTVEGMYMTIIYPVGPVYALGSAFDLTTVEVPAPVDTEVHRVYYSSGSLWRDA
jgi:hypothetical protein